LYACIKFKIDWLIKYWMAVDSVQWVFTCLQDSVQHYTCAQNENWSVKSAYKVVQQGRHMDLVIIAYMIHTSDRYGRNPVGLESAHCKKMLLEMDWMDFDVGWIQITPLIAHTHTHTHKPQSRSKTFPCPMGTQKADFALMPILSPAYQISTTS